MPDNQWRCALIGAGVMALALFVVFVLAKPAGAHHAVTGWAYDYDCCSAMDCYMIENADVQVTGNGYLIVRTGEVVGFDDKRRRESPDGHFHRCSKRMGDPDAETICLYVPGPGL